MSRSSSRIVLLLSILTFLTGGGSCAQEIIKANVSSTSGIGPKQLSLGKSSDMHPFPFHHFVTLGVIRTYQLLISPSKGSSCPMHPHCSLYGYQAFKQYNPAKALLMTIDRLHRCGHDLDNYEPMEINGFVRWADPVCSSPANGKSNKELDTVSPLSDETFLVTPKIGRAHV